MRKSQPFVLFCAVTLGMAGCANKRIVRAAPPSVSTPPPEETTPTLTPIAPPPTETTMEPPPVITPPLPLPGPAKAPAPPRPRVAPSESAEPAPPKPVPPQISPQLSARDLESARANTTLNMTTAEKNLHMADGRQLNAAQKDLTDKISGFLAQAHEAIRAGDWVRALNLAEKARVLSDELVKSF
jgi:type IV secretory pathway VirB10-like protein